MVVCPDLLMTLQQRFFKTGGSLLPHARQFAATALLSVIPVCPWWTPVHIEDPEVRV